MTKNPKPLSKPYVKGYNAGLLTAESKLKQCHNDAYAAGLVAGEKRLARALKWWLKKQRFYAGPQIMDWLTTRTRAKSKRSHV